VAGLRVLTQAGQGRGSGRCGWGGGGAAAEQGALAAGPAPEQRDRAVYDGGPADWAWRQAHREPGNLAARFVLPPLISSRPDRKDQTASYGGTGETAVTMRG